MPSAAHRPASDRSLALGRLAIVGTALAWLGYVVATVIREFVSDGVQGMRFASEAVSHLVVVTLLTGSGLAYLAARQGFLHRSRSHRRVPRADLDRFFEESLPTLTVLVPSYREDARIIRQTLLSAALQEFPYLRVVLLIDDPPDAPDPEHQRMLDAARALPDEISELLAAPRATFSAALERLEAETTPDSAPDISDMRTLVREYERAVAWLKGLADAHEGVDHTERFLSDHVVRGLAEDLEVTAAAIDAAADDGVALPRERLLQLYRRLVWIFRAELSSFERKQYASLSHEPNKAMNLNSYIGLMGQRYREEVTPEARVLRPVTAGHSDLEVPEPDYVLTLDADTVVLPEYCLRLVYLLEQPEHQHVAVAQTPYSAFPGAPTRLERIAGATTDLQHLVHQGLSYYDATFWVGANAILRKRALDDTLQVEQRGGRVIHRYVRDRTVIEDTESSIDLESHGWTLMNYPERLSYSATPPDFGSLCIQRQRWANGGLLILPSLWRHVRERRHRGERGRVDETLLRVNYMASICWASIGLLVLLAYPYSDQLLSPLVLIAAVPYFLAMSADLKYCGYKRLDVLRIYGFNLVLLPINLSGVARSLGQAITGKKASFARTPKVRNRTTAPLLFAAIPFAMVALSTFAFVHDIQRASWGHAVFAGANAVLATYAIVALIGLGNSLVDIAVNVLERLYRPETPTRRRLPWRRQPEPAVAASDHAAIDWEAVLYHGSVDAQAHVPATRHTTPNGGPTANEPPDQQLGREDPTTTFLESIARYLDARDGSGEVVLGRDGTSVVVTIHRNGESNAEAPRARRLHDGG